MESVIVSKNQEQAVEILSGQLLFEELVELAPNQYPKGAEKKSSGDGWSLWVKDGLHYIVVLGVGVFLVVQ
jgi:hypothetical protein